MADPKAGSGLSQIPSMAIKLASPDVNTGAKATPVVATATKSSNFWSFAEGLLVSADSSPSNLGNNITTTSQPLPVLTNISNSVGGFLNSILNKATSGVNVKGDVSVSNDTFIKIGGMVLGAILLMGIFSKKTKR